MTFAKELITTEEIHKLVLGTDNQGIAAWHLAANSDYSGTLRIVWQCAKEILKQRSLINWY